MTLNDLIKMTRIYCRDNNSYVFTEANIKMFINQAIDRIRQYKIFGDMPYLNTKTDEVTFIPEQYQYLLALFAAHRCYDTDERFYEGIEKRNEFEQAFSDLINEIEAGNVTITDAEGEALSDDDLPNYIEYVKNEYFGFPYWLFKNKVIT